MAKFGPWANSDIWALVRGTPDKLLTHFFQCAVIVVMVVVSGVNGATSGVVAAAVVLHVVVVVVGVNAAVCATLHACFCWLFEKPPLVFEWPPFVLWHNHSNFFKCFSKIVLCLHSLTLLINSQHSLK